MAKERRLIPRANKEQADELWAWVRACYSMSVAAKTIGVSYQTLYNIGCNDKPLTLRTYKKFKIAMSMEY